LILAIGKLLYALVYNNSIIWVRSKNRLFTHVLGNLFSSCT
jgi:hypothetical protein